MNINENTLYEMIGRREVAMHVMRLEAAQLRQALQDTQGMLSSCGEGCDCDCKQPEQPSDEPTDG